MSSFTPNEIRQEFLKSKIGLAGMSILAILIVISLTTLILIPIETFQEWNNPSNWISNPKIAMPIWFNMLSVEKIPEHMILENPTVQTVSAKNTYLTSHVFEFNFEYDQFPNDFIYEFSAEYSESPLLQISVIRPDGTKLDVISTPMPYSDTKAKHSQKIFSADSHIKKTISLQSEKFSFELDERSSEDIIFSKKYKNEPLKGNYIFVIDMYSTKTDNQISESKLIIGGKVFGIMGTDELRRDLSIGLLWGTPLALFIGLAVSIASVVAGLLYGVYAGFKGKKTDEVMMRFNDVVYALPALPFLIIFLIWYSWMQVYTALSK